MATLEIEHPVADYSAWKQAFDSDTVGWLKSVVRRYQILRLADNPKYMIIDLELDTKSQAEAMLANLKAVWSRVEGNLMTNPCADHRDGRGRRVLKGSQT